MDDATNWSERKLSAYRAAAGVHLPLPLNMRFMTPEETDPEHVARTYFPSCQRIKDLPLSKLPLGLRVRWERLLGCQRCSRCGTRPREPTFWSRAEPVTCMGVVLTFAPRGHI